MLGRLLFRLIEDVDIPRRFRIEVRNVKARVLRSTKRVDRLIILGAELDLLEVGRDTFGLDTLGNDGVAAVGAPCDEDLSSSRAELLSYIFHDGVVGKLGLVQHCAPRSERDVTLEEIDALLLPRGL